MQIDSREISIVGVWQLQNRRVVEDNNCHRIKMLIGGYLVPIGSSEDGWEKLFRDPKDGRYWELTYPQSDLSGGGPPSLKNISEANAKSKYNVKNI